jgi:hypothetical protein
MKKTPYLITSLIFVSLLAAGFVTNSGNNSTQQLPPKDKHPEVDWSIGCAECHEEMTPKVFQEWNESRHGQVNFGCYICHGDGQEVFYKKGKDEGCLGCHAAQEVNYKQLKVKSCFDCHNGHTLKFHNENK